MSEALKEYAREALQRLLKDVPPEQRVEGLSPEQRLKGLSPEQRRKGLSPEQRRKGLSPEELLQGLSPEELRAIMEEGQRRLKTNGSASEPTS